MVKKHLNDDDRGVWAKVTASVTPLMRPRFIQRKAAEKAAAATEKPVPKNSAFGQERGANTANGKHASGKNISGKPRPTPPGPSSPKPLIPKSLISGTMPANLDEQGYGGISRSGARAIKTGQKGYTSRIDLHGYGRDEAHLRLKAFITNAVMSGHRHVLVITGKGAGGKGVIRSHLPIWLDEPPLSAHVIAYCQAQPKDGGAGAWYVNLRRRP